MKHTCSPEQFTTIRVKTRKHKSGYRIKTIPYYTQTYVMTYEEMGCADIPSFLDTHSQHDKVSVELVEPPYVKCTIERLRLLHYIGVPMGIFIGAVLGIALFICVQSIMGG
jgi:hypothetical protein